ncbi:unnamed protein product [Cuscuta epithymum]|uniref:Uncharacterized protein n=1 Tax=Cuscuta epithymum TaxID=186058 RepID=A0AAV0DKG7_9ASTE|nr:unnamed protein product [Cuscuta epithymum]
MPESKTNRTPTPINCFPVSFFGCTMSGQPGIHMLDSSPLLWQPGFTVTSTPLSTLSSQLTFATSNVTNIVTTRLAVVEDYLSRRVQFESFLVSHGLLGILYGSIPALSLTTYDNIRRQTPNHKYHHWLKIDKLYLRSWLCVTLSRDIYFGRGS